jgi:hypothetical protein
MMASQIVQPARIRSQTNTRPLPVYQVRPRVSKPNRIGELSLTQLRSEIRCNRISFPAQVPTFSKHDRPDLQRKTVQLYFLMGWSCCRIAKRHGILRQRIQQILSTWKRRAIETGYIQEIPPC